MTAIDIAFDTYTMDTAGFVKRARTKLKLSQGGLAERLGLERRTVMRYEQGGFLPLRVYFAIKHLVARHKLNKQRARDRAAAKKRE